MRCPEPARPPLEEEAFNFSARGVLVPREL
jgi:hypothetical protein